MLRCYIIFDQSLEEIKHGVWMVVQELPELLFAVSEDYVNIAKNVFRIVFALSRDLDARYGK